MSHHTIYFQFNLVYRKSLGKNKNDVKKQQEINNKKHTTYIQIKHTH